MMTFKKTITLPDRRTVVMVSEYENNIESKIPMVSGPVEVVLGIIGMRNMSPIEGPDFEGWYGLLLDRAGCTVENEINGEWEMFTE